MPRLRALGSAWGGACARARQCLEAAYARSGQCLGGCLCAHWAILGGVPARVLGSAWGMPARALGSFWGVPARVGHCLGALDWAYHARWQCQRVAYLFALRPPPVARRPPANAQGPGPSVRACL